MLRVIWLTVALLAVAGAGALAYVTRDNWSPLLFPAAEAHADEHADDHHEADHIELTEQARRSIDIQPRRVYPTSYTPSIRIPGVIAAKPGETSLRVTTYAGGVVQKIAAYPGQTVRAGDELFRLHLHSHDVLDDQAKLYQTAQELAINDEQKAVTERLAQSGAIPQQKLLDLKYERQRLGAVQASLRSSLLLHGFAPEQVDQIARGEFVTHRTIRAPMPGQQGYPDAAGEESAGSAADEPVYYEVQALDVKPGEQVAPGDPLCTLSNNRALYIEGRVLLGEVPAVERAFREKSPVRAEILSLDGRERSTPGQPLAIHYVDHHVDLGSQTVGVYVLLENELQPPPEGGGKYRLWKYRPGQRVYLQVPLAALEGVYVLPPAAVVEDGAEAYVFRQNGELFERQPVEVRFRDRTAVVIADDGSVTPGAVLVHNGAAQLYRAMQTAGGGAEHHHHHDH